MELEALPSSSHGEKEGSKRKDLVCFGELLWDIYEDGERKIGGAPFNVAAIASLKGIDAAMITAVGTDELGKICTCASKKITILCQKNQHKTGVTHIVHDKKKIPHFQIEKDAAYDYITYDDAVKDLCADPRFFCFGTLAQRTSVSRNTLRRILTTTSALRIYDVNFRAGIEQWPSIFAGSIVSTDILKMNEEELQLLKMLLGHKESDTLFVTGLIDQYRLQYVFVTRGEGGASLYSQEEVIHRDALKVRISDTTGCGDAFTAGIVYALLHRFDAERTLGCATELAAKIASIKGAVPENLHLLETTFC